MVLLRAKGAREGPRADFSSILASILVSVGGLLDALGVLWQASGSLWVPKWRPGATKEGTEDLQERFCGHLKNRCFAQEKHGFARFGESWGSHKVTLSPPKGHMGGTLGLMGGT